MKSSQFIKDDDLLQQGVYVLMKELGAVETSRFLSLPINKRWDSVKRHQKWQENLDKEQFFKDVGLGGGCV